MIQSYALLYSDGSIGVLRESATLADAQRERADSDFNARPEKRTRVAKVSLEILEIIPDPAEPSICPTCGRPSPILKALTASSAKAAP